MKICICEKKWGKTAENSTQFGETDAENQTQSALSNYQLNRTHYCCFLLLLAFIFRVNWLTELPKKSWTYIYLCSVISERSHREFFHFLFFCYFRFLVYTSVYDYFFRVGHDPPDDCFICSPRVDEFDVFFFKSIVWRRRRWGLKMCTKLISLSFSPPRRRDSLFILRILLCDCFIRTWRKRSERKASFWLMIVYTWGVWCNMQYMHFSSCDAFMAMPPMTRERERKRI